MNQAFRIIALAFVLYLAGCTSAEPELYLADTAQPELAWRAGLGDEVELIQKVELLWDRDHYDLRCFEDYKSGRHRGYLPVGTRLRTEHVWTAGPEVGSAGSVVVTMRILPEHPYRWQLMPSDLPGNYSRTPGGQPVNAYVLPASHARIVADHERTPEDQIVPLTEEQEWLVGGERPKRYGNEAH